MSFRVVCVLCVSWLPMSDDLLIKLLLFYHFDWGINVWISNLDFNWGMVKRKWVDKYMFSFKEIIIAEFRRALEFDLNLVLCIIWQLLLRSFRQFLIFDPSDPLDWRDEPARCYWSWHDMLLGRTALLLSPIEWDELVCSGSRVISSGSTNRKWISTQHLF